MWGTLGAAAISGLAELGGGMMSAQGAAQTNQQNAAQNLANNNMNRDLFNSGQTFQNNVNVANWAYQDKVNAMQLQQSGAQNEWNAAQAQKQMDFQREMSSTAYQRATADMRAAGLNPILAYQQGGASTPAGAAASGGSPSFGAATGSGGPSGSSGGSIPMGNSQAEMGRAVGRMVSSAVDTYRTGEQAQLLSSQKNVADAQETNVTTDTQHKGQLVSKAAAETHNVQQEYKNLQAMEGFIKANTARAVAETGLTGQMSGNMATYGSREAPNTIERMLRMLQGAVSKDIGSIHTEPKQW